PSGSAASTAAVPCLAAPAYAVARSDDTIFAPRTDVHAVLQVSPSSARLLAPLGQRPPGSPASARIQNGIGAIYGLAYDDGALSGTPRLFAAAHLRRFTAFGPGGPGAIYAINPATGAWSLFATVPGNHWDRSGNDPYDSAATARTGTSGLGGIAMHPEGRYLFIVNISERRIERVDVTTGAFLPAMSLAGAYAAIGQSPSDTFPFAITFMPQPVNDLPAMLVGFTNRRAGSVFVAANYRTSSGTWTWGAFLSQNLRSGDFLDRLDGTTLADVIITSPQNGIGGNGAAWNPWVDTEDEMARVGDNVAHPQPILTDLTFAPDGQTLFLGIRDRAGDQLFFRTPPSGGYQVISQGDTLAYRWTGNNWALVSVSRADPLNRAPGDGRAWPAHRYDAFNDNLHNFVVGATPPHIENHMGGLATQPTGVDPAQAQVTATQLFGGSQAGISFYASSGGQESANRIIIGGATSTKAAALGDVEPLCAYAYIQGMVWDDANRDGVRQDGELRRAGVPVELTDAAGTVLAAVATDAQGRYRFAAPPNRDLRVRIAPAAFAAGGVLRGATYTTPNASGDLTRDSDAGPQGISLTGTRSDLLGGSVHDREVARLARQEDRRTLDLGVTTLNPDAWVHVSAPPTAPPTGEIRIDVTVGNRGDFHLYGADAALVRLTLPPGLVPAWVSHNGAVSGQTITWNGVWLTAAPSGDPSVVFTVYAMVPPDRQRGDRLTVEAAVVPPPRLQAVDPPANNQDTATTIVVAPDAWVRVSAPPTALPTQVVRFDVQAGNQGDFHLYGPDAAVVRLTLPPGLIPAWVSHNGAVNGQTITWSGVWLNAV
ncbi:MAG: hypothetical protein N2378_18665, partial [Chloroflexaceae bacterium]|nr:hypothetical protein [Chloroflexaceae bacterium]